MTQGVVRAAIAFAVHRATVPTGINTAVAISANGALAATGIIEFTRTSVGSIASATAVGHTATIATFMAQTQLLQ